MKNRILKAKEVKKALQCHKNGATLAEKIGGFVRSRELQVNDTTLREIASLFNRTIKKTNQSSGYWQGSVIVEGVEVYAYKYDFDHEKNKTSKYNRTKKLYKESFFETDGDKDAAFLLMKDKDKYKDLEKYNSLNDLRKFWKRHEDRQLDVNNVSSQYQLYRKNWERYEEDSLSRYEYDTIRPLHDYWSPATMKEWYKHNFQTQ